MKHDAATFVWVAHASRVLVSASRRNELFFEFHPHRTITIPREVRDGETRALPNPMSI